MRINSPYVFLSKMEEFTFIDKFLSSSEEVLDLGAVNYFERRDISAYCLRCGIHTMSIGDDANKSLINENNIKHMVLSKEPFPITNIDTEMSVINELAFLMNRKIFSTKSSLAEVFGMMNDDEREVVNRFLFQFSLYFSNHYPRLFRHRSDVVGEVGIALSKITIPKVPKRKLKYKRLHTRDNHGKKFVRFDMINAVSSVIGIKDWTGFMSKYTTIELYQKSKPLRGKIMANIHKQCMLLVENRIYELSQKLPYVSINSDEIVVLHDATTDYIALHKSIDPNNDFRMTIFTLEEREDCYAEIHDHNSGSRDGTIKYKCMNNK